MCYFTFKIYRSKGKISAFFTVHSFEAICCIGKVRDLNSKSIFNYAICINLTSSKLFLIAYDFLLLIPTISWENLVLQIFWTAVFPLSGIDTQNPLENHVFCGPLRFA